MSTEILFDEKQIQEKIKNLSHQININPNYWINDNIFICVLNGGFMFYSDLVKHISFPIECDFIRIKSYNNTTQTKPVILKDIELNIENKNIFIIDDILDSGNTIKFLIDYFLNKKPFQINIVTLFKREKTIFENKFGDSYEGFYVKVRGFAR